MLLEKEGRKENESREEEEEEEENRGLMGRKL
jgi:hypothetical protein